MEPTFAEQLAAGLRTGSRTCGRSGFLLLPFILLLLLRGKVSAGRRPPLRCTWCVRCKRNSCGEKARGEKRQTGIMVMAGPHRFYSFAAQDPMIMKTAQKFEPLYRCHLDRSATGRQFV